MAKQAAAPGQVPATQSDEELPKTAVKPSAKDLYIQNLQEQVNKLSGTPVAESAADPIDTEEATFKKRYGDLRKYAQEKENNLKKQLADYEAKIAHLSHLAEQPMPKTKEEFEAWKAKYPDIASFIEIIADEKASQRAGQLQQELGTLKDKLTETEKEKAYATLKSLVPDLEAIIPSPEYKAWYANQPLFVQEELNTSEDPYKIAYYMDIYKLSVAKPTPRTKADALAALDTAVRNTGATPGRNSGAHKYTTSQIAKMSTQEYSAKEADIIAARNSGQILDDTTKRNSVFDQ